MQSQMNPQCKSVHKYSIKSVNLTVLQSELLLTTLQLRWLMDYNNQSLKAFCLIGLGDPNNTRLNRLEFHILDILRQYKVQHLKTSSIEVEVSLEW